MGQGALIWFVVTLLPSGDFAARPQPSESACRTMAAAHQRINLQLGNGKHSHCVHASVQALAASGGKLAALP